MQRPLITPYSEEPIEFLEPPPSGVVLASLAVVLVSVIVPAVTFFLGDIDGPSPGPTIALILLAAGVVLPLVGLGGVVEAYVRRKHWIATLRLEALSHARRDGERSVPALVSIEEALLKTGAYADAFAVSELRLLFELPPPPEDEPEGSGSPERVPW